MKILYAILFLSTIFSREYSCLSEFSDESLDRVGRPERQKTYLSPDGYFMIHYDTTLCGSCTENYNFVPSLVDLDEDLVPDYIQSVAIAADSSRAILVDKMGYEPEEPDSDGVYDIYIFDYDIGEYGWNYSEGSGVSYVRIDKDYEGYGIDPIKVMRLTVGHEYFHAIQRGYRHNFGSTDVYFLEMSSMWFEDIIEPEGNDYLATSWTNPLFNFPENDFNSSDKQGYELALFAHYLGGYIDENGKGDQKNSTILRDIWDRFGLYGNSSTQIKYVLENHYDSPFHVAWNDFMTRNLFNGYSQNPDFELYYYPDQALIQPISTSTELITDTMNIPINYDDDSVSIKSFTVQDGATLFLSDESTNYMANFVTISDDDYTMNIFTGSSEIYLNSSETFHIVSSSSNEGTADIDVDVVFCSPEATNISAIVHSDYVELSWDGVESSDVYYELWRDSELIGTTANLTYNDDTISFSSIYTYHIVSSNQTCSSEISDSVTVETWPNPNSIDYTNLVTLYPNPMYSNDDQMYVIIDTDEDGSAVIDIYDVTGRLVISNFHAQILEGRNRIGVQTNSMNPGIYIVYVLIDNFDPITKKICVIR